MLTFTRLLVAASAIARLALATKSPVVAQYWPAYNSEQQSPAHISSWSSSDIMFYFVTVTTASGFEVPSDQSTKDMKAFVREARAHGVAPIFSLGGWTGSRHFSKLAASPKSRQKFAKDLYAFNERYGFHGVDIDWEYPGSEGIGCNGPSPDDSANLVLLLKEIRALFGKKNKITASVAITGFVGPDGSPLEDVSAFAKYLDYIQIMAYDVSGSWTPTTGPLAPLRSCSSDAGIDISIDYWTGAGFPASKILLGLPSYAVAFTTTSSQLTNTTIKYAGHTYKSQLYNAQTGVTPQGDPKTDTGSPDSAVDVCGNPAGGFGGQWAMKELIAQGLLSADELTGGKGFVRYFDKCTSTPFLFNRKSKTLISYDDSKSIKLKAQYAIQRGLGGVMVFDTLGFTDKVYTAMRKGLGLSSSRPSPSAPGSSSSAVVTRTVTKTVTKTITRTVTATSHGTSKPHHATSSAVIKPKPTTTSAPVSAAPSASCGAISVAEVAKLYFSASMSAAAPRPTASA